VEALLPELRLLIDRDHIREGLLYGRLPLANVDEEAQRALESVGWRVRSYRDRPVAEPPEATIAWEHYRHVFRDNMRHATAHRLPGGIPLAGPKDAILDELIASVWDQRVEELRTVLGAFAFASVWPGSEDESDAPGPVSEVEGAETFYFYTDAMRRAAVEAVAETASAPAADDPVWVLVDSLK
jgi:hypothetical protein